VREVNVRLSSKEADLRHRLNTPLLNSHQLYSPNAVFCEHRTKPELMRVCCSATIRLSCPLLTRVRGREILRTSPLRSSRKFAPNTTGWHHADAGRASSEEDTDGA
jgi:hypothetical protein